MAYPIRPGARWCTPLPRGLEEALRRDLSDALSDKLDSQVLAGARVSPLLNAYARCMTGGILTGLPEPPEFTDSVPEKVVEAALALWVSHHDVEAEHDCLLRVIVDGELLLLETDGVVPADGFEPILRGPDWMREVSGFKVGKPSTVRRSGFLYLGDRRRGEARALPWIRPALPFAAAPALHVNRVLDR